MSFSHLQDWGWNSYFSDRWNELNLSNSWPARVTGEERGRYKIALSLNKTGWAQLTGSYSDAKPCVGDWAVCRSSEDGTLILIEGILPRISFLRRSEPGGNGSEQGIAANATHVAVATSANQDLNVRRLERYATLAWDSGAVPVVVVTKTDLIIESEQLLKELALELPGVEIIGATSIPVFNSPGLTSLMRAGHTVALVGSSGVGKSTLVNHLIGEPVQTVNDIRGDDDRGRHTTTARGLFQTRYGGLIMDTPGMRELAMVDSEDGLEHMFSDILRLGERCKFRDCSHQVEPGCAVQAAIEAGQIPSERWRSYQKLLAEIRHYQRKQNKGSAAAEKERWKAIHKQGKLRQKLKGR